MIESTVEFVSRCIMVMVKVDTYIDYASQYHIRTCVVGCFLYFKTQSKYYLL